MVYTREQKRKIFDSLPEDLKEAILSVETSDKLRAIYDKYSLMLDQAGELGDEVGLFMLGLSRQDDFVKNVSRRLNIPDDKAEQISADINKEIFDSIRGSLQVIQSRHEDGAQGSDVSAIEKVGGFTIEKNKPQSSSPQYNDSNLNREAVLKDIEDPMKKTSESGVSLVDHLLKNPVSNPIETSEVKKVSPAPVPPNIPTGEPAQKPQTAPPPKKYTADPYREPIE